jgi:hypothetical protein
MNPVPDAEMPRRAQGPSRLDDCLINRQRPESPAGQSILQLLVRLSTKICTLRVDNTHWGIVSFRLPGA